MKKFVVFITTAVVFCANSNLAIPDCGKQQIRKAAASRFVLKSGTAYDRSTKLTWSRCSAGSKWKDGSGCVGSLRTMTLDEARGYAKKTGQGWRLPTLKELNGIADDRCGSPYINTTVFPDIKELGEGAPYWSVTQVAQMPSLFYYVDFINGIVDGHSEGYPLAVRLVRDKN
jgi:hypothetical protein